MMMMIIIARRVIRRVRTKRMRARRVGRVRKSH